MPVEQPPMRLLRVLLITLLLLAAIVTLVPEEPQALPSVGSGKTVASSDVSAH